jgi:hypothetical protein
MDMGRAKVFAHTPKDFRVVDLWGSSNRLFVDTSVSARYSGPRTALPESTPHSTACTGASRVPTTLPAFSAGTALARFNDWATGIVAGASRLTTSADRIAPPAAAPMFDTAESTVSAVWIPFSKMLYRLTEVSPGSAMLSPIRGAFLGVGNFVGGSISVSLMCGVYAGGGLGSSGYIECPDLGLSHCRGQGIR